MSTQAAPASAFGTWLDTFLREKEIDGEEILTVEGPQWGENAIPVACLADAMKAAPEREQAKLKTLLVKVDFTNGDVRDCLTHLAKAIAL